MKKKYVLTVNLNVNGKSFLVPLASYDLITLEKYVSYCNNPSELLKFMPNDKTFSVRSYLMRYLNPNLSFDNDPFSIRTSRSKKSNKIKMVYNHDMDVLLANKKVLKDKLIGSFSISLDDCVFGNISKEDEEFLKQLYGKFAGKNFDYAKRILSCMKYNMDDPYKYDERYGVLFNNPWMFIAISSTCAQALVEDAFKDDRKRINFAFLVKQRTGNLLTDYSYSDVKALNESLEKQVCGRNNYASYVRNSIRRSVRKFMNENTPNEIVVNNPSKITEQEIIDYNKQRLSQDQDSKEDNEFELMTHIEELRSCLFQKKDEEVNLQQSLKTGGFTQDKDFVTAQLNIVLSDIKDLEKKIQKLEYYLCELENHNMVYSDAGFIVDVEDKSI